MLGGLQGVRVPPARPTSGRCSATRGSFLTGCTFAGDFLFRGATVCKKFQADGSRFEKLLDVSKAKLHDYAYLEGIEHGPDMRFAFANAVGGAHARAARSRSRAGSRANWRASTSRRCTSTGF